MQVIRVSNAHVECNDFDLLIPIHNILYCDKTNEDTDRRSITRIHLIGGDTLLSIDSLNSIQVRLTSMKEE